MSARAGVTVRFETFYLFPMSGRFDTLPHRRAIIDRRVLADALAALEGDDKMALRRGATNLLKGALDRRPRRDRAAAGRASLARAAKRRRPRPS